jgi:putative membrane protein
MGLWCGQMTAGGWALMAAIWAAVIGLAVWAVCRLFPAQRGPDPRVALDARLAAGDVDLETYRELGRQLDEHGTSAFVRRTS